MPKNNLDLGALAEFAQQIHAEPTEQETVQRVLEFALSAVGADFAGVLFSTGEEVETVAATDPVVERVAGGEPAESLGIRSSLSVRVHTAKQSFGTLDVFSCSPGAFAEEDLAVLQAIARIAAVALSSTRKEANLWRAIDSRKLVGQAQGILMERFDLDADQAFAVLVRYSQTQNVKVVTIAGELINTRLLPGAPDA